MNEMHSDKSSNGKINFNSMIWVMKHQTPPGILSCIPHIKHLVINICKAFYDKIYGKNYEKFITKLKKN